MVVSVIYKETYSSSYGNAMSEFKIMEVDPNENNAIKYGKLFSLQLPPEDRKRTVFKTIRLELR